MSRSLREPTVSLQRALEVLLHQGLGVVREQTEILQASHSCQRLLRHTVHFWFLLLAFYMMDSGTIFMDCNGGGSAEMNQRKFG